MVLSVQEVGRILTCVHHPRYRFCLSTLYACGLRLLEGVRLQVKDIDGERKLLHVSQGEGGKDSYVPLPNLAWEGGNTGSHRNPYGSSQAAHWSGEPRRTIF